jgi:hypothetical protein
LWLGGVFLRRRSYNRGVLRSLWLLMTDPGVLCRRIFFLVFFLVEEIFLDLVWQVFVVQKNKKTCSTRNSISDKKYLFVSTWWPPTDGRGLRDFSQNWTYCILQEVKRKFLKIPDILFRISWITNSFKYETRVSTAPTLSYRTLTTFQISWNCETSAVRERLLERAKNLRGSKVRGQNRRMT